MIAGLGERTHLAAVLGVTKFTAVITMDTVVLPMSLFKVQQTPLRGQFIVQKFKLRNTF
jgi:hypothetical protein